jgi:hypothetical protein
MAKSSTATHETISRRLHLLYDGIMAQAVPDRLAAILTTLDEDHPAALPAPSLVA